MAVMKTIRALTIAAMLVTVVQAAFPQRARSAYDPAANESRSKPRDSFIDFTLKRINSSDKNYGAEIADNRNLLVTETVESRYFWSNLIAVAMLGFFFILLVFQQRRLNRHGWKSAETIAQYEHALERTNAQVEDVTNKYGEMTQAFLRLKESALRAQPSASPEAAPALIRQDRKAPADQTAAFEPAKNGTIKVSKRSSIATPTSTEAGAQIALFKADADLVSKINSLEQQLGRSKDVESELRRQLNDLGRKLQAEQDKNRSLKGA